MSATATSTESRQTASRNYQLGLVGAATFIVMLMVISGASGAFSTASVGPSNRSVAAPLSNSILTPSQLNHEPFLSNPSSANGNGVPAGDESQAVSPSMPMTLFVSFQPRDSAGLKALINAESTPGNPQYMHHPSVQQIDATYGPSPATIANADTYFTSQGFKVTESTSLGIIIQGTAAKVDSAFKTSIVNANYQGKAGYVNSLALSLPQSLATQVLSIAGVNSFMVAHPMSMVNPEFSAIAGTSAGASLSTEISAAAGCSGSFDETCVASNNTGGFVSFCVNQTSGTFGACTYGTTFGQSPYSQFIYPTTPARLLDAVPLQKDANTDGSGINIAVVMGGGINPGDVQNYSQQVYGNACNLWCNGSGVPTGRLVPFPTFNELGFTLGSNSPSNGTYVTDGDSGEMALDMEYSSAMAPGAGIEAVYGPDLSTLSLDADYLALAIGGTPQTPLNPQIISNSWGGDENLWWNYGGPSWQSAAFMDLVFQIETASGVTVLASSGDSGGYDSYTGVLSASFPASDPYVLPVDGARLTATGPAGPFPTPATAPLGQFTTTLAAYATSPTADPGLYFPGIAVNASTTTGLASSSYWYSNGSATGPDYAAGGIGFSEWFNQSWWSVGPGEPWTNHNTLAAVAAEADFNQSYYFDGGWNYFWGGTSFACPTVAGELALTDSMVYSQTGVLGIGLGDAVVNQVATEYASGNITLAPYMGVSTKTAVLGQNFWDGALSLLGETWQPITPTNGSATDPSPSPYYPGWNESSTGFNQLTGYGLIDAAHFSADVAQIVALGTNGATVSVGTGAWASLALGQTYAVTVDQSSTPVTGNLHVLFWPNDAGTPIAYSTAVTAGAATLDLSDAAHFPSPGLIEINFTSTPAGSYQILFGHVGPGAVSGLTITALGPKSLMGGFSSPSEIWPLMPNQELVQVKAGGHPVAGAVVTVYDVYWNETLGTNSFGTFGSFAGITNDTGMVWVDTWNTLQTVTYNINVSVGSAVAGTSITVTPQLNISTSIGPDQQGYTTGDESGVSWEENDGDIGAIGVWDGEVAPLSVDRMTATGGLKGVANAPLYTATYNFGANGGNGSLLADNPADYMTTGATGSAQFLIPQTTPVSYGGYVDSGAFAPTEFIAAANTSYANTTWNYQQPTNAGGTTTFSENVVNDVSAWPLFVQADPVSGAVFSDGPAGIIAGGNTLANITVNLPSYSPITGVAWTDQYEHIVSIQYQVDTGAVVTVPATMYGAWAQSTFIPEVAISNSSGVGAHTLTWWVTDSLGHVFTDAIPFSVVVTGSGTVNPSVTILEPSAGYVYSGGFALTVEWQTAVSDPSELANLAEVITVTDLSGTVVYTNGLSTQTFSPVTPTMWDNLTSADLAFPASYAGNLPAGGYLVTITASFVTGSGVTPTGVSASQEFFHGVVAVSGPLAGTTFSPGNVTISFSYTWPQAGSVTLTVSKAGSTTPIYTESEVSPLGGNASSVTISFTPGKYYANLTAEDTGTDTYANATTWFNVVATPGNGIVYKNTTTAQTPFGVAVSALGAVLIVVGVILGLLVGMIAASMMRRKPEESQPAKAWEPTSSTPAGAPPTSGSTMGSSGPTPSTPSGGSGSTSGGYQPPQ